MTSNEGGFYSSLDADSEGEEGKFYVWKKNDLQKVLGERADLIIDYYNVYSNLKIIFFKVISEFRPIFFLLMISLLAVFCYIFFNISPVNSRCYQ